MLKLISWNVNGLRACYDKGFTDIFRQLDADFFCLQETKMQAGQLDLQFDGYRSYWNYAEKKGYSGTAVFTRLQPISVSYGMDRTEHDREGRIITLEMEDFFLVNVYTPNSQEGLKRLEYRMTWEDDFLHFLKQLETQKPVIVCGDLNVAHQEIDLKIPKRTEKTPDLPMKSAINSPNYCLPDSPIHSAIFILIKKTSIRGGLTDSKREKKTPAGVSIIFLPPHRSTRNCAVRKYTRKFLARTIVPWSWKLTYNHTYTSKRLLKR